MITPISKLVLEELGWIKTVEHKCMHKIVYIHEYYFFIITVLLDIIYINYVIHKIFAIAHEDGVL